MADTYNRIGSGHTDQELAAANWWVLHRQQLRTAGYGALIAWSVLTWGYGLWTLFDAYALSYPREQRYIAHIASATITPDAQTLSAPQPLQPGGTTVLALGSDRQQFVAPANNPNPLWWATIRYRFRDGDSETPLQTTDLLPNETRFLTELGWQGTPLRTPSLSIETVEWKRIDPFLTQGDYPAYKDARTTLSIEKPQYQSDLTIEGKPIGQSTFLLRNPSGFSYRNVELLTFLYRGGTLAGANKLLLPSVSAGASQTISLIWPENPIGITKVEAQPFVRILDPETFRPPTTQ